MENYKVYMHTFPNDMKYVGLTKQKLCDRWGHVGNGYIQNKEFWEAIQLVGWNNIKHEVLFETTDRAEAVEKEQELILKYKTYDPHFGYNKNKGGNYPDENRCESISRSNKGRTPINKGKEMDDDFKRKLSEGTTEEQKIKFGLIWKGKKRGPQSEEHKKKRINSMKGKKWWNNGEEQIRAIECPVGFVAGRLKKKQ